MRCLVASAALLAFWLHACSALADPWFGAGDNALEDAFLDGDIDGEDAIAMRVGSPHGGGSDVHGQSWISVAGFHRVLTTGAMDNGGILVVSFAFDRLAEGNVHRLAQTTPVPGASPTHSVEDREASAASPRVARACVVAAWRTAGLGEDDSRIDAIIARSRASAWFPETRFRAERLWDDSASASIPTTTASSTLYDELGANLILELRLTWRLDRLIYAGDEATFERMRMERQDARTRVATRALEALFAWERAAVEAHRALDGSREEQDARLRRAEAEATLEVLTGGWFSHRNDPAPAPPPPAADATDP
jgi:hypothetical protein